MGYHFLKSWITAAALLSAFQMYGQSFPADFSSWDKKNAKSSDGAGAFGGGEAETQAAFTSREARVISSGAALVLQLEKASGGVQFEPTYAGLPVDWPQYATMDAEMENISTDTP